MAPHTKMATTTAANATMSLREIGQSAKAAHVTGPAPGGAEGRVPWGMAGLVRDHADRMTPADMVDQHYRGTERRPGRGGIAVNQEPHRYMSRRRALANIRT